MGRILKILVYAVILFFVYLWISTMIKSCGSPDQDSADLTEEDVTNGDDIQNLGSEDTFFEEDRPEDATDETDPAETIDYTEIDNTLNDVTEEKEEPETTFTPTRKSNPDGRYMVIAGSYLLKNNAKNMVTKLEKQGFSNAEIVVFDLSQYHSVSAGRFNDYSDAQTLANDLKSRGIDCYVHSKK